MRFRRLFGKTIYFKDLQKRFFTVPFAADHVAVRLEPPATFLPKLCQKCGEKRKRCQKSGEI